MAARMGDLSVTQLETVVGWFLHRMGPEQRRQLMAELPLHYRALYPGASASAITGAVQDALNRRGD